MYTVPHQSCVLLLCLSSLFSCILLYSLHLIHFSLYHSFVLSPSSLSLYARVLSAFPPRVLCSSSQLVPCAPVLQFRLQYVRVLGLKAQLPLLLSFPRLGSVPVGFDCLVVPDHRCFRVADVARVSCVMGRIHQKRLGRERTQVPTLKVVHVL